jgi:hypothetical protein
MVQHVHPQHGAHHARHPSHVVNHRPPAQPESKYHALKRRVLNRGTPSDGFLDELIAWGRTAPQDIFLPNGHRDVYSNVVHVLGPWRDMLHRRAVMLEVMRVLAGFETSWRWNAGLDTSKHATPTPQNTEAGAWQVSADSMGNGLELKALVQTKVGSLDAEAFQRAMKHNHALAMEYIARLLRRTVRHNGPVKRHEIDAWLHKDAVEELVMWLAPMSRPWVGPHPNLSTFDDMNVSGLGPRGR